MVSVLELLLRLLHLSLGWERGEPILELVDRSFEQAEQRLEGRLVRNRWVRPTVTSLSILSQPTPLQTDTPCWYEFLCLLEALGSLFARLLADCRFEQR